MTNISEGLVKDLVCGMALPKNKMQAQVKFSGKVYYFCSKEDKEKFEADPEKWISKEGGKL